MGSLLRLDIDTAALFAAFDAFADELEVQLRDNAEDTAERVAREARARVRRRTGKTEQGITVEASRDGKGFVVFVARPEEPGLPGWLEFGTRFMGKHEFFFASARLEEEGHDRRALEVVENVIEAKGLGE